MSAPTSFLGLAPFLRRNINGSDLRPLAQEWLPRAEANPEDANLWMNLSSITGDRPQFGQGRGSRLGAPHANYPRR